MATNLGPNFAPPISRLQLKSPKSAVAARPLVVRRRAGGRLRLSRRCHCSAGDWVLDASNGYARKGGDVYLARESGWGVRRMTPVGEEMRRVARIQAEAFHEPVPLLNGLFFEFFQAEVLSALIYRVRNSPPDRYACLVAEDLNDKSDLPWARVERLVGVVDITAQSDDDVLKHIEGAEEYLYVSGIAVLQKFRRRRVGTALLSACDSLSAAWRSRYLALRAYEDDLGAQQLYTNAGYEVVSKDPLWTTWIGKRRRVLMIKKSPFYS